MDWLKRLIIKWALDKPNQENGLKFSLGAMEKDSHEEGSIRLYITSAIGGRIVRVTHEMSHNINGGFKSESQTYVIPSGEDVGSRVAKIINLEILK